LPPAARGIFLKKPPPGPPQKLLIKIETADKNGIMISLAIFSRII
jgi:hypothetical protein